MRAGAGCSPNSLSLALQLEHQRSYQTKIPARAAWFVIDGHNRELRA
jgi:hypothetical protein